MKNVTHRGGGASFVALLVLLLGTGFVSSRLDASRRKQATSAWSSTGARLLPPARALPLFSAWSVRTPQLSVEPSAQVGKPGLPVRASLVKGFGKSSLSFEANEGQSDPRVKFLSRGMGYTLYLTSIESVVVLRRLQVDSGQLSTKQHAGADSGVTKTHSVGRNLDPTTHDPDLNLKTSSDAVMRMRFVGANPKLTLHATSYDWQFIPIAGQTFTDSGTQACH